MATTIEREVAGLLKGVHYQFREDVDIIGGLARKHHSEPVIDDIFAVLTETGLYHVLLPFQWDKDAQALLAADTLNEWCSDSRQSVEVANSLRVNTERDAKIVMGGGGSQVFNRRQAALAAVERAFLKHNPRGEINKVVHSGFCAKHTMDYCEESGGDPWAYWNMITRGGSGRDGDTELNFLHYMFNNAMYELMRYDKPNIPEMGDLQRVNLHIAHVTGENNGDFSYVENIR